MTVIVGASGTGKSHLLAATEHRVRDLRPDAEVWATTARQFGVEYVDAIRQGGTSAFRRRCQKFELVLIDDVDDFAHMEGFQAELGSLARATLDAEFVLAVQSLEGLDPLAAILLALPATAIVPLAAPSEELRCLLLQAAAGARGVALDEETLALGRQLPPHGGEIIGFAQELTFFADLWGERCSAELAMWVLALRAASGRHPPLAANADLVTHRR